MHGKGQSLPFQLCEGKGEGKEAKAERSAKGTGVLPSASTSSTVTWYRPMLNTLPMYPLPGPPLPPPPPLVPDPGPEPPCSRRESKNFFISQEAAAAWLRGRCYF